MKLQKKKNDEISKKYFEINKGLAEEIKELKENLIQNKNILSFMKKTKS